MARDAMGKMQEAAELDKMASNLAKRDPNAAHSLREMAKDKRKKAIKQMKPRRRRKGSGQFTVLGPQ